MVQIPSEKSSQHRLLQTFAFPVPTTKFMEVRLDLMRSYSGTEIVDAFKQVSGEHGKVVTAPYKDNNKQFTTQYLDPTNNHTYHLIGGQNLAYHIIDYFAYDSITVYASTKSPEQINEIEQRMYQFLQAIGAELNTIL